MLCCFSYPLCLFFFPAINNIIPLSLSYKLFRCSILFSSFNTCFLLQFYHNNFFLHYITHNISHKTDITVIVNAFMFDNDCNYLFVAYKRVWYLHIVLKWCLSNYNSNMNHYYNGLKDICIVFAITYVNEERL